MKCLKCGFVNALSHKFCCECGAPFAQTTHEAERRSLTVMFCDLVGSTALSEQHDPEDLRKIIAAYQDCCRTVIKRYDGFIARYMGDGLLIYFGYPTAHEDDAQRAIRAALDIVAALPLLEVKAVKKLAVRIGVATGDVVIGDNIGEGAAEEVAVLGMTPNLAARLQSVAGENQIVISEGTRHRLEKIVELHDMGTFKLKGISAPVQAWQVGAINAAAVHTTSSARFVGRQDKLAAIQKAYKQSLEGAMAVVHVEGQAGIGKTRLVHEFLNSKKDTNFEIWSCSAFHQNVPLHPVPADVINSVKQSDISAESQRQLLFDAVSQHLLLKTKTGSFVLCVEDAHWMDPTTVEYLSDIQQRLQNRAILIIIASRPSANAQKLANAMGGRQIKLKALRNSDSMTLVKSLLDKDLSSNAYQKIVDRAGGMPLFLEELANVVSSAEDSDIPDSLQESLLARLDSLGPLKRLAQLASIFGRSFDLAELAGLLERSVSQVKLDVDRLIENGVFVKSGENYTFRHALMQEVSYETLLLSTRYKIHGEIADRLISTDGSDRPELIARHLEGAKRYIEAAKYWCHAAQNSAKLWAHAEATVYYEYALAHNALVRDNEWEFVTRLDYVDSLRIVDRYDVALIQLDAAEILCKQEGSDEDWLRLNVLRGNILFPMGETDLCVLAHQSALRYAKKLNYPEAEAKALSGIGDACFLSGKIVSAEKAYDDCVKIAQANQLDAITLSNISLRGHMRVYLCRLDEAEADCRTAVELAVEKRNRRAELTARGSCYAKVLYEKGQLEEANEVFIFSTNLAKELGAHRFEALNLLYQGKVALEWGKNKTARALAKRAVKIARQYSPQFCLPMALGVVARAENNMEVCKNIMSEAEMLIKKGCAAHNPLWYYRDAILTAAEHGWADQVRRYAQALRHTFSQENIPWCNLIANGADALADLHEKNDSTALLNAIKAAEDIGFFGWAMTLKRIAARKG